MQVTTDPTQPVMAGMPERADVFVSNSPVFTTLDGFDGSVLAKFASDSTVLRSGFLRGPQYIRGFAAALDVKHERGHVVLARVPAAMARAAAGDVPHGLQLRVLRAWRCGPGEAERGLLDVSAASGRIAATPAGGRGRTRWSAATTIVTKHRSCLELDSSNDDLTDLRA